MNSARVPLALIVIAAAAFVTTAAVCATAPQATAAAKAGSAAGDNDGFVGSQACQSCHEPEFQSWRQTLHVQMTKPVSEALIVGDFSPGAALSANGRTYTMEARDGRRFISIARSGRPAERFEINYTLGAKRFQGYLSKLPDGRIYVLPVFWHNEAKRWLDYKEITPIPNDPSHDLRQIWNVTCVNCHATNIVRNFNRDANSYATTWTEMGIGCEACHGPGRPHIDDPEHLHVFSMKKNPPRQIFDTCGYCHGNKNNAFFGFKAGDRYDDFALPFLISQPIPANDPQGDFWPDGRPSRFNRPQALTLSGCFARGEATCTSCHRMHGTQNNHSLKVAIDAPGGGHSRESDQLCTQCHGAGGAGRAGGAGGDVRSATASADVRSAKASAERVDAHTHHAPDSQGSRCINCHMSDVNWRLITRRLDHTFQPPVPEMTAKYGVPNACTTCHEDKPPEWAAAMMDRWYGNGASRKATVELGDTIYRAGTGDARVLPQLAKLAVDRSRGSLIRASAAEFAGQLLAGGAAAAPAEKSPQSAGIDTSIVNALIGAAADSDPWVRITAVRALGAISDPRVTSALAAHLVDSSRVVRVSAAEALMSQGIVSLEGAAGGALARAQDEWADSLRTFNDDAHDQTALGWLEAARGQTDAAVADLTAATRLDGTVAKPHVYLGVLAARAGKYSEAVQHFRTAKSLSRDYPNIDRLIDEAEKRR